MIQYELRGGARIGLANASFPLAKLKVNKEKLELNVSILGNLVFSPGDVISIEPHGFIPVIGKGIKINHRVPTYKRKVIFWTFENPSEVIAAIKRTGFLEHASADTTPKDPQILERQQQGGFPIKTFFIITVFVMWNALIVLLFLTNPGDKNDPNQLMFLPVGFLLAMAVLPFVSPPFRQLMLKEGRGLDDIQSFLYFIIFICLFMLGIGMFVGAS